MSNTAGSFSEFYGHSNETLRLSYFSFAKVNILLKKYAYLKAD